MGSSNDLYQNTWSFWWFQQAVDNPEIDLYHTNLLFYPKGASLYAHALSPLNGVLAYPLQKFLPWHQVYNSLVIFNYVASGLSLFWFAYYYTKKFFPSFIAGAFFTFSTYHFAQSRGHIEMASMQWLVFFLLSLVWLLDSPKWHKAVISAVLLSLTLFNTPYQFLYASMTAIILTGAYFLHYRLKKKYIQSLVSSLRIFILTTLIVLGPFLIKYLSYMNSEELMGSHNPVDFSAEIFNYFARPENYFGEKTKGLWPNF